MRQPWYTQCQRLDSIDQILFKLLNRPTSLQANSIKLILWPKWMVVDTVSSFVRTKSFPDASPEWPTLGLFNLTCNYIIWMLYYGPNCGHFVAIILFTWWTVVPLKSWSNNWDWINKNETLIWSGELFHRTGNYIQQERFRHRRFAGVRGILLN